jgi:hypothetical protein
VYQRELTQLGGQVPMGGGRGGPRRGMAPGPRGALPAHAAAAWPGTMRRPGVA